MLLFFAVVYDINDTGCDYCSEFVTTLHNVLTQRITMFPNKLNGLGYSQHNKARKIVNKRNM